MTPEQFEYIRSEFADVKADLSKVMRHVDGGSEPERGLNTRVLILERDAESSRETARHAKGVAWGAAGTAVTAAVLWAWSRLTSGPHD